MKQKKFDGADTRRVLAAMITNDTVCSRIASQWDDDGMFGAAWADLVGSMVVRHHRKYSKAPGSRMVGIYERWAATTVADDKTVASIERFLQDLSDTSDEIASADPQYLLDIAATVFNKAKVERQIEIARMEIERGEVANAAARFSAPTVNLGEGSYANLVDDLSVWEQSTATTRSRALVRYRGILGKFIGDAFHRGSLYAFMASEKVGKTTYLIDLLYRCARARCNVVFFDCGDSIQEELVERIALRTAGLPRRAGTYRIPIEWKKGDDLPTFDDVELEAADTIDAYRTFRKICSAKESVRLACYSSGTLSVADMDGLLSGWARDGWKADVVLADYADILAPPKGIRDKLDQIDETWLQLRRLSQKHRVFCCTATQVSASSYGSDGLLSKKHFQGRRTKYAHVNGIIGINVSSEEKRVGMARLNWIVRRGAQYNERDFVRVVGSPALASPIIFSQR